MKGRFAPKHFLPVIFMAVLIVIVFFSCPRPQGAYVQ